ncbi:MAG: energy transducer TonB [Chitinophagaceae bacterium]|nr:energy transducer TonB [Chitinophagaceae bacterium]
MEKNKILQASLLDIVFDNRNKIYGAYELRSRYSGRLSKALLITGALALVVLLASFVSATFKTTARSTPISITEVATTKLIEEPIVEPPPPPPVKPLEQPQIEMSRLTSSIKMVEELKPEEVMKDIDDMIDTKISTINQAGDKTSDIVSPPIEDNNSGIITGPKKEEKDEPLITVQIQARFPGGDEAWRKYISREMERHTDELQEDGKAGTCIVQFIVDKDGKISDVEALSMKGTKLAELCINAIRKGPDWAPAENNGMKVKAWRKQPVTFRIDNF